MTTKEHTIAPLHSPFALPYPIDMETYISQIYFIGDYVYKVKKPVDYGYLDFTTLGKRKYYCQREVDLNRRLCPDIYLGVVPVAKANGGWKFGGKGRIVDYAVWMKRLPQDRMLDALLAKDEVAPEMMATVAEKLAEFHKEAKASSEIRAYGHPFVVLKNSVENFIQAERYIGEMITAEQHRRIKKYSGDFITINDALFRRRIMRGKIRDCHGDLHTQHICFAEDGIKIFDCIEFSDRFRYGDVASEVAFLSMDLDFHRREDLSRVFVGAYVKASGDKELVSLLDFYKVYRAYVRGKIYCFRLEGIEDEKEREQVVETAREYFKLAGDYIK